MIKVRYSYHMYRLLLNVYEPYESTVFGLIA